MNIAVISDTHLNTSFSQSKCETLQRIIRSVDLVVLNGDFWDGYEITFDQFLQSRWSVLFPLLKEKHAVYVFGNHDKESFSDERRMQFCDHATHKHTIDHAGKHYVFEHGDQYVWKIDKVLKITRPVLWLNAVTEWIQKSFIQTVGIKGFWLLFGKMNRAIKRHVRKAGYHNPNTVFFGGHTHFAEIDLKNSFVNTGVFKYGYAQYALIHADGSVTLKDTLYKR